MLGLYGATWLELLFGSLGGGGGVLKLYRLQDFRGLGAQLSLSCSEL